MGKAISFQIRKISVGKSQVGCQRGRTCVRVGEGLCKALAVYCCPRTDPLSSLQAEQRLFAVGIFSISSVWEISLLVCQLPTSCLSSKRGLRIVLCGPNCWGLQIYDLKSADQLHPFRTGAGDAKKQVPYRIPPGRGGSAQHSRPVSSGQQGLRSVSSRMVVAWSGTLCLAVLRSSSFPVPTSPYFLWILQAAWYPS